MPDTMSVPGEAAARRSATAGLVRPLVAPANPGIRLAEIAHEAKLNLRGDLADPGFAAAVAGALGLDLPARPGIAAADGVAALWLGPTEWLVVGGVDREADLAARLQGALAGRHAAVTNVTDNWTVIALAGPKALDVLAKGCPLDLHPRSFPAGSVAQSMVCTAAADLCPPLLRPVSLGLAGGCGAGVRGRRGLRPGDDFASPLLQARRSQKTPSLSVIARRRSRRSNPGPVRAAPDEVDGPRTASVCQDEVVEHLIEGGRP